MVIPQTLSEKKPSKSNNNKILRSLKIFRTKRFPHNIWILWNCAIEGISLSATLSIRVPKPIRPDKAPTT